MRLTRPFVLFVGLLAVAPVTLGKGPPALVTKRVFEIQVADDDTFYVLEEATSGTVPVRFLSAKRFGQVTHITAVLPSTSDKWISVLRSEIVEIKPLTCAHPRRMKVTSGKNEKVVEFCPGDFKEARRKKLQKLGDEMREHLASSVGTP